MGMQGCKVKTFIDIVAASSKSYFVKSALIFQGMLFQMKFSEK